MALEPIDKFTYTRDWTKPADFPTFEDDEQTVRADMQYQPDELKKFINETLVTFINDGLVPLVNALVAGTIPDDSVYTAAIKNGAVTLVKLGADVTAAALGAPATVNGVAPDETGNIAVRAGDIPMSPTDSTTVAGAIQIKQPQTSTLTEQKNPTMLMQVPAAAYFPLSLNGANFRVSFSLMQTALKALMLGNKSISTEQLNDAVVTSEKLAALAVLSTHIAAGAVTGQKIATETILNANYAPGSITKNKLANDAKYLPFAERDSSASMYITSAWGGYLNYVVGDNGISIDSAEYGRLEDNWQADIISGNKSRVVAFTGIPIINAETGLISEAGGATVLPVGKTLRIKKTPNAMLVGGSFGTPAIYSGATDPTGGNDGDIYIQYSE